MKELVKYLAKAIVDKSEEVMVTEIEEPKSQTVFLETLSLAMK